jgi:hypothetical protein
MSWKRKSSPSTSGKGRRRTYSAGFVRKTYSLLLDKNPRRQVPPLTLPSEDADRSSTQNVAVF